MANVHDVAEALRTAFAPASHRFGRDPLDASAARRVRVRFMAMPEGAPINDLEVTSDIVGAVGMLLARLGVSPDALVAREIQCGGPRVAVLLVPRSRRDGEAHHAGRVVALALEGLNETEINLGLIWHASPANAPGGAA